jgi:hypothetical protein
MDLDELMQKCKDKYPDTDRKFVKKKSIIYEQFFDGNLKM